MIIKCAIIDNLRDTNKRAYDKEVQYYFNFKVLGNRNFQDYS